MVHESVMDAPVTLAEPTCFPPSAMSTRSNAFGSLRSHTHPLIAQSRVSGSTYPPADVLVGRPLTHPVNRIDSLLLLLFASVTVIRTRIVLFMMSTQTGWVGFTMHPRSASTQRQQDLQIKLE